ncbi:bifunctional metallophosphatase/5'-nucleotidase [Aridibaculum aurantiacum]|uniref:bifunctional metallophosphatase/5'-nucleotidase n=1 Tax=Aridibaculum aurantiacum TaxID=2810307 RepID=UPI001A977C87|nr:bifunctional metallophosphatase/5'-nucleotidase [Aridibaculum aurantiacum]
MKRQNWLIAACFLAVASCKTTGYVPSNANDDGKIEVVFVQVNDVYEIQPLAAGKEGGMARVAALKKEYKQQNPNTFLVMAGDFLSPSVYNSLQYQGKRIRGKQMVEAMNVAGMDYAVFGNHEFDITENELQDRINESGFMWIASNTFHKTNGQVQPFRRTSGGPAFPETHIMHVKDADGTTAKIGFIGLTLPFNRADYVSYTDVMTTAKTLYNRIKDSVDAVVALTHLLVEDDQKLAKEIPGLALIMGGHEHNMRFVKEGKVYITKAHANAKSAYVNKLLINRKNGKVTVTPQLRYIDETIGFDSLTNIVVNKWTDIAEKNYSSLGFDARAVVMKSGEPLDGREEFLRKQPTNLTRLIVKAMHEAAPQADVAIVNSGSIRVDDILPVPVTQYDIIRSMPFGGGIREVDMKGNLLIQTLETGRKNTGIGGYLLHSEFVTYNNGTWMINNASIDPNKTYRVAISDFLLTGKEANMDFLNEKNKDIVKVYPAETSTSNSLSDIRLAIVRYLQKQ